TGSTMTKAGPASLTACSMKLGFNIEVERPRLGFGITILDTSAPAESKRGRIVSLYPSSQLIKRTFAGAVGFSPKGKAKPLLTAEAMTRDSVLFPLPGSPSSMVIRPIGILLLHNQSTFSGLIWSMVIIRGSGFLGSLLAGSAPLPLVNF